MEDATFSELETDGLIVRRFRPEDTEAFSAYRNDPDVARHQGWEIPYSAQEANDFISELSHLSPGRPGTWFQFAVAPTRSSGLIGDVGLRTTSEDPLQGEIGFSFASASQGHGYATKAVTAVVKYAVTILGMRRVFAITDARNTKAQDLLERIDFELEQEINQDTLLYSTADSTPLASLVSSWNNPRVSRRRSPIKYGRIEPVTPNKLQRARTKRELSRTSNSAVQLTSAAVWRHTLTARSALLPTTKRRSTKARE